MKLDPDFSELRKLAKKMGAWPFGIDPDLCREEVSEIGDNLENEKDTGSATDQTVQRGNGGQG